MACRDRWKAITGALENVSHRSLQTSKQTRRQTSRSREKHRLGSLQTHSPRTLHQLGTLGQETKPGPGEMIKLLVLPAWYGLSDPEMERQASNRSTLCAFSGTRSWRLIIVRCGRSENVSPLLVKTGIAGLSCSASWMRRD
jgi:hypothetical protein